MAFAQYVYAGTGSEYKELAKEHIELFLKKKDNLRQYTKKEPPPEPLNKFCLPRDLSQFGFRTE